MIIILIYALSTVLVCIHHSVRVLRLRTSALFFTRHIASLHDVRHMENPTSGTSHPPVVYVSIMIVPSNFYRGFKTGFCKIFSQFIPQVVRLKVGLNLKTHHVSNMFSWLRVNSKPWQSIHF